jgi:hypothetical protein
MSLYTAASSDDLTQRIQLRKVQKRRRQIYLFSPQSDAAHPAAQAKTAKYFLGLGFGVRTKPAQP